MLPMLEREVVERNKWTTREQLLDYFAIGQCTPGIIAVNTATVVGYNRCGFWGASFATAGVVTPSFVIILARAMALKNFSHIPEVASAFAGIRAAVAALIFVAVVRLFMSNVVQPRPDTAQPRPVVVQFHPNHAQGEGTEVHLSLRKRIIAKHNVLPFLLFLAAFVAVAFLRLSPAYAAIGAAVAGIALFGRRGA
jgi:hypothetical protein